MSEKNITLEQVGKLKDFADVSFADAKEALEAADGDLLDALVWLERAGKIPSSGVSSYSTRDDQTTGSAPAADQAPAQEESEAHHEKMKQEARRLGQLAKRWLVDNRLEAYHRSNGGELQVPLGVALVLLIMAFWLVPVLLILGYILGWRYRLAGPDLDREDVNQVMENLNDTANDVVTSVKKNLNKDV